MTEAELLLLKEISDLDGVPAGAHNIRKNSGLETRLSTENIKISSKEDVAGIDIHIAPGTKNESVHIPVLISESGIEEMVYNDFFIGENSDVVIIAGCGIHNSGHVRSQHDGIHRFFVGKNAKITYSEKHYGTGEGTGERVMNPTTEVYLEEGAVVEMETIQIAGVDSTKRLTRVEGKAGSETVITEKLLTHGTQFADSRMQIVLDGENANARVISRSVAQDNSVQEFFPDVIGRAKCFGHIQCDAIIMGQAVVKAIPAIEAAHSDANLVHEAAIGRIAGDQILKLQTLGLTAEEAEERILKGFLS